MNYLRAIAGFLCLCTVAGCTSSVSQQETLRSRLKTEAGGFSFCYLFLFVVKKKK